MSSLFNVMTREKTRPYLTNVKFDLSNPRILQRNGKVERKFQTFFERIRTMLKSAGVKDQLRSRVWAEYANTVTFLLNVISIKNKQVCPYELLFDCKPKFSTI
jgi:hypothetical protein